MSVKLRQQIERRIVRRIISDAIAAGYQLSVQSGGDDDDISNSVNVRAIMEHAFAVDDCWLLLRQPGTPGRVSWVRLVFGNSGWDVVNDYTTDLEELMAGANQTAEKLEELYA